MRKQESKGDPAAGAKFRPAQGALKIGLGFDMVVCFFRFG
jgi:hypothetical protein